MKTAVSMLEEAFKQWQRDWDNYEENPLKFNKPKSMEEFIKPFLEKEKQQIIDAWIDGDARICQTKSIPHAEEYYNQTFNQ